MKPGNVHKGGVHEENKVNEDFGLVTRGERFGGFSGLLIPVTAINLTARFEHMTIHGLSVLVADATPVAPDQTGAQIKFFATMIIFVVILWVLMIAPQRKKTKELEATLKSLKMGDKIVTSSGIIGVVLSIKDRSVSIRSADTKLEILKTSVAEVTERSGETSDSKS